MCPDYAIAGRDGGPLEGPNLSGMSSYAAPKDDLTAAPLEALVQQCWNADMIAPKPNLAGTRIRVRA